MTGKFMDCVRSGSRGGYASGDSKESLAPDFPAVWKSGVNPIGGRKRSAMRDGAPVRKKRRRHAAPFSQCRL